MEPNDLQIDVLANLREILLLLSYYAHKWQHVHGPSLVPKYLPEHQDLRHH
jgi:hypothetical protein